jgi:hypothetical protein
MNLRAEYATNQSIIASSSLGLFMGYVGYGSFIASSPTRVCTIVKDAERDFM